MKRFGAIMLKTGWFSDKKGKPLFSSLHKSQNNELRQLPYFLHFVKFNNSFLSLQFFSLELDIGLFDFLN